MYATRCALQLSKTTRQKFCKFKSGDFGLRSNQPVAKRDERLLKLIEDNPLRDTREVAEELQYNRDTMAAHHLGKARTFAVWMPNGQSYHKFQVRRDACINFSTWISLASTTWLTGTKNRFFT